MTTRLSVLATACVTGLTLLSASMATSMYEAGLMAVAAAHVLRATGPSRRSAHGKAHKKDMIVSTPNKFSGVMFSPLGLSIEARERMLRVAKARLDSIAPPKDSQVKDSSEADASATPKTMGTSAAAAGAEICAPRMAQERPAVQTGSAALTIWVKETAPAPAETTAPMWPRACMKLIGRKARTLAEARQPEEGDEGAADEEGGCGVAPWQRDSIEPHLVRDVVARREREPQRKVDADLHCLEQRLGRHDTAPGILVAERQAFLGVKLHRRQYENGHRCVNRWDSQFGGGAQRRAKRESAGHQSAARRPEQEHQRRGCAEGRHAYAGREADDGSSA
eukprot:scaffold9487_cov105-Isochrysis_galbana.AAC.3